MAANTWIFLGTTTGSTAYNLSNVEYKELFVIPKYNQVDCTGIRITPLCENYNIFNGYTTTTPRCIQIRYSSSNSTIAIRHAYNESSSPTVYTNNMTMDIYYR